MRRVPVCNLSSGLLLNEPLYSQSSKLLLAPGKRLSSQMYEALMNGKEEFVFLGKWDDVAALRFGATNQVSKLRAKADQAIDSLRQEYDERLNSMSMSPVPTGPAMAEEIDRSVRQDRPADKIDKFVVMKNEGEELVEGMVNGWVHEDEVGQAALAVTEKFASAMCEDPSLLTLMSQARKSGTYLFGHSVNVSILSMQIGTALAFGREQVTDIGTAALMQDLGMAMVPEEITSKPSKLDALEMLDVQKHTYRGVYLIERFRGIPLLARFLALQCHERVNGQGYPRKRPAALIHRFAKIVSVADIYESLISDRPWRQGLTAYAALEQIIRWASKGNLDREAVKGLLFTLSLYPIGTFVKLSNGETGRVIAPNGAAYARPVVSITQDSAGSRLAEPSILDLEKNEDLRVVETLDEVAVDHDEMAAFVA
jgi:HD-GYP domain-containing protein (c-di-GMP phosphodiesterase class II)